MLEYWTEKRKAENQQKLVKVAFFPFAHDNLAKCYALIMTERVRPIEKGEERTRLLASEMLSRLTTG